MTEVKKINKALRLYLDENFRNGGAGTARMLDFCASAGISREHLIALSAADDRLKTACEQLFILEEKAITTAVENGDCSASFAMMRLKEKPFCYSDKADEEILDNGIEIEIKIV